MATNIPTVEEFNEELPVSSWDRNTVADGNWLQANTIGPLKNRDDKIIELLQGIEAAGNSWKNWSEEHGSTSEDGFENSYYIGSGNYVRNGFAIGDNNTSSGGVNIGYNNYVETNANALDNPAAYGNFNIGKYNSACYNADGNIAESYNGAINIGQGNKAGAWGVNLGENNIATLGAYNIGGRCSASRGSFVMGYETIAEGGSVAIGFNNSAYGGEVIIGRDNDGTNGAGDYIIGHDNTVVNGGAFILGAGNSAQGNSFIIGSKNHIRGGSIGIGDKSYATGGSTVIGIESSATAGSLVLLGDNTIAYDGSIAIGGETSASRGSISVGDNGNNHKNLVANGSYNIGQNNSAKGGVYVIGNNNNANYEVKYDVNGHIIEQNTNTTILGDNNYTENYIGEYSAIDRYTNSIDDGEGHIYDITGYSAKFTGKTRSLIVGNNNSAIGWNQYSFGDKNFNGSTVYAYDSETSSYKTSGLKYRDTSTFSPLKDFYDDLGYTFTFGRGNSAVRMFDMAIGLSSFASGGQNIAIGYGKTHIQGHNISSPDFTTTVKEGSRNIVYNSYLPGGYDNKLFESYLDFGTFDFAPMYQSRNELSYAVIENNITGYTSNSWFADNIIHNSYISAENYYMMTNNKMLSTRFYYKKPAGSDQSFIGQNIIEDSRISADMAYYNMFSLNTIKHTNMKIINNNENKQQFFTNNIIFGHNSDSTPELNIESNYCFTKNILLHPKLGNSVIKFRPDFNNFISNNFMHQFAIDANHNLFNSMLNENFINGAKLQGSCKETYNEQTETYQYTYAGILPTSGKALDGVLDINHTVAFGGTIKETNGCFIFAETSQYDNKPDSIINGAIRLYDFGDNSAAFITDSFIIGCNEVSGVNHSFINGYNNLITYPVSLDYSANDLEKMNHGLVLFGDENTIDVVSANNSISNNTVRGNKNIIKVESEFTDNRIIGNQNIFADINNSIAEADYNVRYNTLESSTPDYSGYSAGEAKQNYRNYIAGSKNIISNAESNNYIMGDANIVVNTTPDDIIYANNVLLGNAQLAKNGSNQLAIGHGNVANGYYSMAIGERLSAAGSQLVVGRYNAYVDGTDGTNDSNSGALFIVGNGHCPVDGHTDAAATRSNAMVVSADGTVSAKTYKADPGTPLGKLFDFLATFDGATDGDLHWDTTTSNWIIQ